MQAGGQAGALTHRQRGVHLFVLLPHVHVLLHRRPQVLQEGRGAGDTAALPPLLAVLAALAAAAAAAAAS